LKHAAKIRFVLKVVANFSLRIKPRINDYAKLACAG
jgi:hypothetical protein